uniref:Uncharacterized protein n=1 Tax=Solanum lycopersicum TaxID=4081 RepID=A0A3Q7I2R3_SOLLC
MNWVEHYEKDSKAARQDVFESSMCYMMRNYPQLMHKFMSNKAKIPYLLKLIVRFVFLINEASFNHGEREALRSCIKYDYELYKEFLCKESNPCIIHRARSFGVLIRYMELRRSYGPAEWLFEYSLLVNLKMLDDLQLLRQISIKSLHNNLAQTPHTMQSEARRRLAETFKILLLHTHLHVCSDSSK